MSLDSRYFTYLFSKDGFDLYAPKNGSAKVLFSEKDGTSLAALHFQPQKTSTGAHTTLFQRDIRITGPSDSRQHFQGIIDRSGQEFELVITNLCHSGYLNYNIFHQEAQPGASGKGKAPALTTLNEINELRPLESYAVQCDQTKDNTSLVLNFLDASPTSASLVKDDDAKTLREKRGVYLDVVLAPDSSSESMCNRFAAREAGRERGGIRVPCTVWKVVPVVIIPSEPVARTKGAGGGVRMRGGGVHLESFPGGGPPSPPSMYRGLGGVVPEVVSSANIQMDAAGPDPGTELGCAFVATTHSAPRKDSKGIFETASFSLPTSMQEEVVQNSRLAKIGQGRKIEVHGQETEKVYDYDCASRPVTLGLSIMEGLRISPVASESLMEYAKDMLDYVVGKKFSEFLGKRHFESDQCTICLDPRPDVVFFPCAHVCLHGKCDNPDSLCSCPLCRQPIEARIAKRNFTI